MGSGTLETLSVITFGLQMIGFCFSLCFTVFLQFCVRAHELCRASKHRHLLAEPHPL